MKTRTVIFDLDGTLIDSRADLAAAVNRMRAEFGLSALPVDTIAGFVGEGLRPLVARALSELPQQHEAALTQVGYHYGEHLVEKTVLYPGVILALEALSEMRYALAVVTNKPQAFSEEILRKLGIAGCFAAIVGGGTCRKLKPDPESLLLALERTGCEDISGSWIAGDHFTDLEAGRHAGLKRCYCRYGFGDPRSESYELAVDSLPELPRVLRRRRG